MQFYLIAAAVWALSLVGSGFYWHHQGYEDATRDAKARETDTVVAGISAANELAAADLAAAVEAERSRSRLRTDAADRRAGLEQSVRVETVYRDRDCVLPDADRLRINAALAAAREAGSSAAGRGDGAVPRAAGPADAGRPGRNGDQLPGDGGSAGRVQFPAARLENLHRD